SPSRRKLLACEMPEWGKAKNMQVEWTTCAMRNKRGREMLVKLDKIASVTARSGLCREVEISDTVLAERGAVVVVEALEEKDVYGELELLGGRLARIIKGDIIAGVLGERQALKGFVGSIPEHIEPGD